MGTSRISRVLVPWYPDPSSKALKLWKSWNFVIARWGLTGPPTTGGGRGSGRLTGGSGLVESIKRPAAGPALANLTLKP